MRIRELFYRSRKWCYSSINRRLVIWSILFWIVAIALLSVSILVVSQTRMIRDTAQRNTQLASVISEDINTQVNGIYSDNRSFAVYLESISDDLDVQAGAVLSLRLSSPAHYRAVYYFDNSSNPLFSLSDSAENLLQIKDPSEIVNRPMASLSADVYDAYNTVSDGISISDVSFTEVDRVPVVYMGQKLTFSDGTVRVIITEIDLSDILESKLDQITIGQSGFAYAVSKNGVIVADPDKAYVGRQIPINLNPVLSGFEGYVEYTEPYTGHQVLAAYSSVGGQLGWGVVVQQDRSEAYAAAIRTSLISLGILILLAVVGTVGIIIAVRRFTKPIVELTGQARKIAETGDMEQLKVSRNSDEVGQMGTAFSRMVDRIRESENMFRSIVENSHAGIFIIDSSFHLIYANNRLAEMLGGTRQDIIGRDFREFLDEDSKVTVAERYTQRQNGRELPSRYEFGFIRRDGERRLAELSSTVVQNAENKTVTVGQILDITDRKTAELEIRRAHDELETRVERRTLDLSTSNALLQQEITQRREIEEKLRLSETKYRDLVENANNIVLEMDKDGNIIYFNPFAQKFFGFSESEILGRSVIGTIVPETDSHGQSLKPLINDITEHPEKYSNSENENVRSDGEKVWIAWTNKGVYDQNNNLVHVLSTGIDRTEQRRADKILEEKTRSEAAAVERTRLARDLHDAVSQTLFSAALISDVLPRIWEKNHEEGLKRLDEVRQLTRGALAEMRTLLFELRPDAMAEAELEELLKHLADSVTGRSRLPVSLEIEGDCSLAPKVKIALYRIAQEALNNVAKHSGASRAQVTLQCQPHQVELHIKDNGHGFDVAHTRPGSFGIGNMKERADGIGASMDVESKPGEGTEVTVFWQDDTEDKDHDTVKTN